MESWAKRRRKVLIIMAAVFVVAVLAVVLWPGEREPEYEGKKLSEWLASDFRPLPPSQTDAARRALSAIGVSNALPWLVRWATYDEPEWKYRAEPLFHKLPRGFRAEWLLRRVSYCTHDRPWVIGSKGLAMLGSEAAPAVPQLARAAEDASRPRAARRAMRCLAEINGDGRQAVMRIMESGDPRLRAYATNVIQTSGPNVIRL